MIRTESIRPELSTTCTHSQKKFVYEHTVKGSDAHPLLHPVYWRASSISVCANLYIGMDLKKCFVSTASVVKSGYSKQKFFTVREY